MEFVEIDAKMVTNNYLLLIAKPEGLNLSTSKKKFLQTKKQEEIKIKLVPDYSKEMFRSSRSVVKEWKQVITFICKKIKEKTVQNNKKETIKAKEMINSANFKEILDKLISTETYEQEIKDMKSFIFTINIFSDMKNVLEHLVFRYHAPLIQMKPGEKISRLGSMNSLNIVRNKIIQFLNEWISKI